MGRGENQNRHNKEKKSPGEAREEKRDCGAQDCQQDTHAGYERLAGMERELGERKRLERKIFKWEWKKQYE